MSTFEDDILFETFNGTATFNPITNTITFITTENKPLLGKKKQITTLALAKIILNLDPKIVTKALDLGDDVADLNKRSLSKDEISTGFLIASMLSLVLREIFGKNVYPLKHAEVV